MSSIKRSEVDAVADAVIDWAESRKLHRPFRGAAERFDELFEGKLRRRLWMLSMDNAC